MLRVSSKNGATLKSGLGLFKVTENDTNRQNT